MRIYFVGEARYDGELTQRQPWTGPAAWAGNLSNVHHANFVEL